MQYNTILKSEIRIDKNMKEISLRQRYDSRNKQVRNDFH